MEEEYINQLLLYPQVMRKTGFTIDWDNLKIIAGRGFDLRGSKPLALLGFGLGLCLMEWRSLD